MSSNQEEMAEAVTDYRRIGFVANPFAGADETDNPYWVEQLVRAEANRLLRAVDRATLDPESSALLLQYDESVPDFYRTAALNRFLRDTGEDATLNVLALNIGLEMMRVGRIRGTLTEIAELVAAVDFDVTLGAYVADVLGQPDETLPEHEALAALDIVALAQYFAEDPRGAVAEHFGELAPIRKSDDEANAVLHETYMRQVELEADPADSADNDEDVPKPEEAETEEAAEGPGAVARYVVAHLRAHLSPVVARAVRGYIEDGFAVVAQELKVTKAPKKTLAAVAAFATHRWRKLVVVYDNFDSWPILSDEMKALVVGSLSELRWTLRPSSVFVISLPHGFAPEIEEQFAAAKRLEWDFEGVEAMLASPTALDASLVLHWLQSASLSPEVASEVESSEEMTRLISEAEGDLLRFGRTAHAAFEHAAMRGRLDKQAVDEGLLAQMPPEGL